MNLGVVCCGGERVYTCVSCVFGTRSVKSKVKDYSLASTYACTNCTRTLSKPLRKHIDWFACTCLNHVPVQTD